MSPVAREVIDRDLQVVEHLLRRAERRVRRRGFFVQRDEAALVGDAARERAFVQLGGLRVGVTRLGEIAGGLRVARAHSANAAARQ